MEEQTNIEQTNKEPTQEEIQQAQEQAEQEAIFNARIIGRLTIQTSMELIPQKAQYYHKMFLELRQVGFSKEDAILIVSNLKV